VKWLAVVVGALAVGVVAGFEPERVFALTTSAIGLACVARAAARIDARND
jgi:hypothetical protein